MKNMLRGVVYIALWLAVFASAIVHSEISGIEGIRVVVIADPATQLVYVNETITMSAVLGDELVEAPLINATGYRLLGASGDGGTVSVYIDEENHVAYIDGNGSRVIAVNYTVTGFFESLIPSMDVYEAVIDTQWWGVDRAEFTLVLPRDYNVTVTPEYPENTVINTVNNTIILIRRPGTYSVIAYRIAEPQIPGGTNGGAAGGAGGGVAGEQAGGAAGGEEGGGAAGEAGWLLPVAAGLAAVAAAAGIYLYMRRPRRGMEVEVVTVPSTDILRDETARDIIVVVGDAGGEGVKQSRIVSVLGKPKSTISRRIKRMEEDGFIEVIRSGRHNFIKLTEKGWEAYRNIIEEEKRQRAEPGK